MRYTQKKWCAGVDAYEGYYMVIAKDNQPTVRQDLEDFFADQELDGGEWEFLKKYHLNNLGKEKQDI